MTASTSGQEAAAAPRSAAKDTFSQATDAHGRAGIRGVPSSALVRFATLAAVWAFSVSQPVFAFLRGSPEFLVLRDATRVDTIIFAILLAFGPPLVVVAYTALAGLVSRWVRDVLYLVALAVFLVPFAFQLTKPFDPSARTSLIVVLALSTLAVLAYVRVRALRLFVAFAAILPVAALLWFVVGIPTTIDEAQAAQVDIESHPPVVLLVLDELPVSSLMTRDGRIDGIRYPAFGRLARDATWYRNATSVHPFTVKAVPSILTGKLPTTDSLPTLKDHPHNLFTLLGGGYSLFVREATTRLCPENLCPRAGVSHLESIEVLFEDVRAPYILKALPGSVIGAGEGAIPADGTFGRASDGAVDELDDFLDLFVRGNPSASLYYAHVLLPHFPWRYLPSGRTYDFPSSDHPTGRARWSSDPWLVEKGLQRHLLQLQYTDALLGQFLEKLRQVGLYDRALIVVAADHGASFRPGTTLRDVAPGHVAGVASVPLFVKYPKQERGVVDDRAARTVDIVPTIADVLGVDLPWHLDGSSLLGPPRQGRVVDVLREDGVHVRASVEEVARQNAALVRRNAALLGEGHDSLYAIGRHTELLGTKVADSWPDSASVRVEIDDPSALSNVRTSSPSVPAHVSGVVQGGRLDPETELAVVVNGRIRALTRCVQDGGGQRFGALVPDEVFRDGGNVVEVFAIEGQGSTPRLVRLGGSR
jgi:hypothetical protein